MKLVNSILITSVIIYTLFFVSAVFALDNAQAEIYDAYLSKDNPSTSKASKTKYFDCQGDIFATMKLRGLSKSLHKIETFWFGPDGKLQGKHLSEFHFLKDGTIYSPSISLLGTRVSPLSIMLGLNNTSFVGDWRLKVKLDGKIAHKEGFSILC